MAFQNSGIFIINKPFQWTSNDVIRKIKSNCKFKKIGHAGTLDPLATGILPILVNDSTKYFDYFQTFKKSYLAEIKFGFSTSSYDLEGDIDAKTDNIPQNIDLIKEKISYFIGSIKQVPPKYSAIKKNGKRLYDYARNDEDIEIESREVEVSEIKIIDWKTPILKVIINCSSGFYVRSFANDLGKKLGSLAVLTSLSRINYGPFEIKDSINIENINPIEKKLISIDSIFLSNKKLVFDVDMEKSYYNGKVFTSENLKLRLENELLYSNKIENDYLREFLNFQDREKYKFVGSDVISRGNISNLNTILIDRGFSSGIKENDPVLSSKGVIGKIVTSSQNTAVVQLISDGNFRLSVRIMPSEAEGILRWRNDTICDIFEIKKTSDVNIGDLVVTSNLSTYFPPSLPVGEIVGIHDKSDNFNKVVRLKLHSDLSKLNQLFVIIEGDN